MNFDPRRAVALTLATAAAFVALSSGVAHADDVDPARAALLGGPGVTKALVAESDGYTITADVTGSGDYSTPDLRDGKFYVTFQADSVADPVWSCRYADGNVQSVGGPGLGWYASPDYIGYQEPVSFYCPVVVNGSPLSSADISGADFESQEFISVTSVDGDGPAPTPTETPTPTPTPTETPTPPTDQEFQNMLLGRYVKRGLTSTPLANQVLTVNTISTVDAGRRAHVDDNGTFFVPVHVVPGVADPVWSCAYDESPTQNYTGWGPVDGDGFTEFQCNPWSVDGTPLSFGSLNGVRLISQVSLAEVEAPPPTTPPVVAAGGGMTKAEAQELINDQSTTLATYYREGLYVVGVLVFLLSALLVLKFPRRARGF